MQYMCRGVHNVMRCVYHRMIYTETHKHVNVVINTHVCRRPKWHESTVQIRTSQAHETRDGLFKTACGNILFVTDVATDIITVKYPRPQNVGNGYLPDTAQTSEAMLLSAATARRPAEGTELLRALNQGFGVHVKEYHAYCHFWLNRLGKK